MFNTMMGNTSGVPAIVNYQTVSLYRVSHGYTLVAPPPKKTLVFWNPFCNFKYLNLGLGWGVLTLSIRCLQTLQYEGHIEYFTKYLQAEKKNQFY